MTAELTHIIQFLPSKQYFDGIMANYKNPRLPHYIGRRGQLHVPLFKVLYPQNVSSCPL